MTVLSRMQVPDDFAADIGHVVAGFETLRVHRDVDEGGRAVADGGVGGL